MVSEPATKTTVRLLSLSASKSFFLQRQVESLAFGDLKKDVSVVINIDQEFRNLLWPLSAVELSHLEQSIASEGCREKLIVWQENNTLVDGHNRYEICKSVRHD